jgi:hypothetical protein
VIGGLAAPAFVLGRRHAPPLLEKLSVSSLSSTRRLRRFRWLVFHTSLLERQTVYWADESVHGSAF